MTSSSTNRHPLCPPFIKFKLSPQLALPKKLVIPASHFQLPELPSVDVTYETQLLEKLAAWEKELADETQRLEELGKKVQLDRTQFQPPPPPPPTQQEAPPPTHAAQMDVSEFEIPADPWNLPSHTNVRDELKQLQTSYLPAPSYTAVPVYPVLPMPSVPSAVQRQAPVETPYQRAIAMGFPIPAVELALQLFHDDFKKLTDFCILYPTLLQGCAHFDLVVASPKLGPHLPWDTYAQRLGLFAHFCEMGFEPPRVLHALLVAEFHHERTLQQLGLS